MYPSIVVRVIVLALMVLVPAAAFAATSTGATLIPGIINELPKPTPVATPSVVKPVLPVAPTPVAKPVAASSVSKVRTLSRGMSGTDVLSVQRALIALSFLSGDAATGYFGPLTETAVKNFQSKNNIVSSGSPATTGYGAIGPRTRIVFASGQAVGNTSSSALPSLNALTYKPTATTPTTPPAATAPTPPAATNVVLPEFTPVIPAQSTTPTVAQSTQRSCTFNGQTLSPGAGVFAYAANSVPYGNTCVYELRMCADGQLSGSYPYTSCSQAAPVVTTWTPDDPTGGVTNGGGGTAASCVWNGSVVAAGTSVTAYQSQTVPFGGQCVSESRLCSNGGLTGTYPYATCTSDAPLSCTFNGQTIANGLSVNAYQSASVAAGNICATQSRVCTNGVLSGTYAFAACTVSASSATPQAACAFNGATVPSGGSVTAYQSGTVPYGTSCVGQQRVCNNGALGGSYTYATCQAAAPASCTFNGSTVGNGVGVTAYQAPTVPFGSSCVSEIRNCGNGTLSGTYQYSSCTVSSASSCTLNGQTIANGASVAAFQTTVGNCASQTRTCTNGTLSGSSAYAYDRCAVPSSNASLPNMYVPATYNGVGVQLQAWYATPAGSGPFPAIILAHGCNGLNPDTSSDWTHQNSWASTLRSWGYATLIVDSFTARGYPNGVCSNGNAVNGLDHALDMYSAATVLAKTANINPQKIGVFGSSHGANAAEITMTANRASTQAAFNALNAAGGKIAGAASLYPICDPIGSYSYYAPLFVAAGADDNWDSPAVCKSLTNYPTVKNTPVDLNAYGALVRMIVYQNATHAFDVPGSTDVITDNNGHTFAYSPSATADVQTRIKAFFDAFVH